MNPERRLSFKADNVEGFAEIVPEKMSEGFIERELSTGKILSAELRQRVLKNWYGAWPFQKP